MENARTVHAACKLEYRSICRSVELTADVFFLTFLLNISVVSVVNRKPKFVFFGRFFVGFSNRQPTCIGRFVGWKKKPKPENRLGFSRSFFSPVLYPNKAFISVWKPLYNFYFLDTCATRDTASTQPKASTQPTFRNSIAVRIAARHT